MIVSGTPARETASNRSTAPNSSTSSILASAVNSPAPPAPQPNTNTIANTNEHHLNLIAGVEEKIVQLVKVASAVIETLAFEGTDNIDERKEEFSLRHQEFTELLMAIQKTLRTVFRHLTEAGIFTSNATNSAGTGSVKLAGDLTMALQMSSLPYQSTVEGFETDFRLSVQGLHVLSEKLRSGVLDAYGIELGETVKASEGRDAGEIGDEMMEL
ncbi:hypothetical protein HDU98_006331 [Podochytrium sp. JEL0797]|nr:hypothetical protein HDU98_006331 [Podochytrium sp. JEL0797]